MNPLKKAPARGQVLPIALAVLMVLTIFVPLMVFYAQRDSIWTVRQAANTRAFHLAEAGVEKAFLTLAQSTATWNTLMNGTAPAGYNSDVSYSDVNGGTYAVSITSGPGTQQATVISVGRDSLKNEIRSLKVIYGNSVFGNVAIYGGTGVQISGGVTVEWGAVMSPQSINTNSLAYPQFYSASSVLPYDSDPNPPNSDGVQWWSYYPNIPPPPSLDFNFYRSSAQANTAGGCPAGGTDANGVSNGSCYFPSSVDLSAWSSYPTSGVVFAEGDVTGKKMYHVGTMIVMGNFHLDNGNFGKGTPSMAMPTNAWKQYGNAWAHYLTFDSSPPAPATYPGPNNTYTSGAVTKAASKCAVNGLLYINGNVTDSGGGGNAEIYGDMYVNGSVIIGAHSGVTVYFNNAATNGLVTTNVSLARISWQNGSYGWPSGLP